MKKKISLLILSIFVLIQFIPVAKNKSSINQDTFKLQSELENHYAEVVAIIETSCYDCHSNTTSYPWYNNIAPVSWYLAKHIKNGKQKLNFNEWASYTTQEKSHLAEEVIEVLKENEMPLKSYTLIHRGAKLNEAEKDLIIEYFSLL